MKEALIVVSCPLIAALAFLVVYDLTVHESRKTEKPVLYLYPQRASYSFTDEAGAMVTPGTFIRGFMTIREADADTVSDRRLSRRCRRTPASQPSSGAQRHKIS